MNLAHDYTHPTPHEGYCRIRLYLPEDNRDVPLVICTEPENNPGRSVTNAAARLAAEVIAAHGLEAPIWVEHYEDSAGGTKEDPATFDLVTFSSYEPRQYPDSDGWTWRIGAPSWGPLGRTAVETLVGGPVS